MSRDPWITDSGPWTVEQQAVDGEEDGGCRMEDGGVMVDG